MIGSAFFLAVCSLPRLQADPFRTAFALPLDERPVLAKYVQNTELRFADRMVVDLNEEFYGVKRGDVRCYVSKRIPPLVRLRQRFAFAQEVVSRIAAQNDGTSIALVAVKSLSRESQNALLDLSIEHFGIETTLEQLQTQSFGFNIGGRMSFSSPVGTLREHIELDQNPAERKRWDDAYQLVRKGIGVLAQDPRKEYDRSTFPTSRYGTYRASIGYFPEREVDSTLVSRLSEAVDDVVREQKRSLQLQLEARAKGIFSNQPKYYSDLIDKSPLSEAEVAKWKRLLKTQLREAGNSDRRIEEILAATYPGPREFLIYMDALIQVSPRLKPDRNPVSAFIWP